jgi:hypothetical protein
VCVCMYKCVYVRVCRLRNIMLEGIAGMCVALYRMIRNRGHSNHNRHTYMYVQYVCNDNVRSYEPPDWASLRRAACRIGPVE